MIGPSGAVPAAIYNRSAKEEILCRPNRHRRQG